MFNPQYLKMIYDLERRVFLAKSYFKFENISVVQKKYRAQFKCKDAPSHSVILNMISVFETTGSVMRKSRKPEEQSEKRKDTKNELNSMFKEFPNLSIRKAASALDVSTKFVFTILHDDLHLKSYKYHNWHKLEAHDYEKRVKFATWFLSKSKDTKFFFHL
jgi:hypothetical protein